MLEWQKLPRYQVFKVKRVTRVPRSKGHLRDRVFLKTYLRMSLTPEAGPSCLDLKWLGGLRVKNCKNWFEVVSKNGFMIFFGFKVSIIAELFLTLVTFKPGFINLLSVMCFQMSCLKESISTCITSKMST